MRFRDRTDAGRHLAGLLEKYRSSHPLVLGLVRGGVAVAAEIAGSLGAPLDVLVVRKVGVPGHPELAMGAAATGVTWLNEPLIAELGIPHRVVEGVVQDEMREVERREALYRRGREPLSVKDRTVIVVDDGLATGATAVAGLRVLRQAGARRLVFAAPVCSSEGSRRIAAEADEVVCASQPADFYAVSQAYESFAQLTDSEVHRHLDAAAPSGVVADGGVP